MGWVIHGPLRGRSSTSTSGCLAVTANRISVEHLQEMLVKQYNHDFNERSSEEQIEMSREEIKFMNIMNTTTVLTGEHYCIDLPFRQKDSVLPNNRCVGEQRLRSLKRKMDKNGPFKDEYITFLNNITQEYAEMVPADQLKQMTMPLPDCPATVLAVRVDNILPKELRFHTFVANRTAFIRAAADVDQWRYVGSKENPADEASRGLRAEGKFVCCESWQNSKVFDPGGHKMEL